jgi:hypothetical protein
MSTYSQLTSVATTMLFTHRSNKDSIVYPSDPRFDDDDDDADDEVYPCVAKLCQQ